MAVVYNSIKLNDIRSFADIQRSADSGNVIFARAVGCSNDLNSQLADTDRAIGNIPRCAYRRITAFGKITDNSLAARYTEIYNSFSAGNDSRILSDISDITVKRAFASACREVSGIVSAEMPSMSETIRRNMIVSFFYWADTYLKELLSADGSYVKKFICSGKAGYREYAFCMILARLGIDVLMILPEGDAALSGNLGKDSVSFVIGPCRSIAVNEPVSTPVISEQVRQVKAPSPVDLTRPPRRRNTVSVQQTVTAVQSEELSFEQLAELASSVVMIAVADRRGNILGTGSGIVISDGGYILTNFHVIRNGAVFAVRVENDDRVYETSDVVKYHPDYDLAIIRIGAALKPLRVFDGKTELKRGQKVVAIGSPMGLFNTVSDGIISGFRDIRDKEMIQFTAPISGGSSGGALLDMYGRVIGISTAGIDEGQNLNLAVSFREIRMFAGNFIS